MLRHVLLAIGVAVLSFATPAQALPVHVQRKLSVRQNVHITFRAQKTARRQLLLRRDRAEALQDGHEEFGAALRDVEQHDADRLWLPAAQRGGRAHPHAGEIPHGWRKPLAGSVQPPVVVPVDPLKSR